MRNNIPAGYKLHSICSPDSLPLFHMERPDGTRIDLWWTTENACIDAMWVDVRARATAEASSPTEKYTIDALVRIRMARAGYVFDPEITALETVEKLLDMLNGKH